MGCRAIISTGLGKTVESCLLLWGLMGPNYWKPVVSMAHNTVFPFTLDPALTHVLTIDLSLSSVLCLWPHLGKVISNCLLMIAAS